MTYWVNNDETLKDKRIGKVTIKSNDTKMNLNTISKQYSYLLDQKLSGKIDNIKISFSKGIYKITYTIS